MGVDYFDCIICGNTFNNAEEDGQWCDCYDGQFCSDECAKEAGLKEETQADGEVKLTCSFCRKEEATDEAILNYLLHKTGLSWNQAVEEWKKEK